MKICYINNLYRPYAVGGAERVIEDLVKSGDAVISWRPWSGWSSWKPVQAVEGGVTVYRYWAPNIFSYKNLSKYNFILKLIWHKIDIFNFWSTRIVKKILKLEKPDIVNTHNLMGIGFWIPRMVQRLGIKHIHTLHDVQLVEPSGVLSWDYERDSVWQRVYSWVMKWRMGRPDEVVTLSRFLQDFYKQRGFFGSSNWKLMAPAYEVRHTKYEDSVGRFLFVGSLVKHKGIEVLMQAWDKLPKDFHGELHIVGDGVIWEKVEEWAKSDERVKVYGRLEKEDLNRVYEKCDVLVFPSICIENRPNVILEAMTHGLKIIASDTGGVSELVQDDKKNKLVRPGDVDILKQSILD